MRDLPEKVGSKYKFITVSAKRCEMLQKGARPKIGIDNMTKFTTVAREEVLDDLIDFRMITSEEGDSLPEEIVLETIADAPAPATEEKADENKEDEKPTE